MIYKLDNVRRDINNLPKGIKTKDYDNLIKSYIKKKYEIEFDLNHLREDDYLQRAYFFVNTYYIKDYKERFLFIDKAKDVFTRWFNTDQIIKLVNKCDFNFMFSYAKKYVDSSHPFIRRWGYVMFIFHKDKKDIEVAKKIITLCKNDNHHDVMMAMAWLLCELAIFNPDLIYDYLSKHILNYKITSMAVGKIRDSFRIDQTIKNRFLELRAKYEH